MDNSLIVSSSPHIRGDRDTRSIMLDVIIALCFPLLVSVYYFELTSLYLVAVGALSSALFEFLYRRLMKKPGTLYDLSAVVTGMLLAFTLPPTTPYWVVIVGSFFAIVIVKQLYGGIGKNFMNPALAARAFLVISFPGYISNHVAPSFFGADFSLRGAVDAVSTATPLDALKNGLLPEDMTLQKMLLGEMAGSLGETTAIVLLLAGMYLWVRGVITPRIPAAFIGTVAVLTFLFPLGEIGHVDFMLYSILSGGVILGAVFMATDYSTSPVTPRGQLLYGIGCGALTVFIRYFGKMPEGAGFAILLMNTLVWALDKIGLSRRFGVKPLAFLTKGGRGHG